MIFVGLPVVLVLFAYSLKAEKANRKFMAFGINMLLGMFYIIFKKMFQQGGGFGDIIAVLCGIFILIVSAAQGLIIAGQLNETILKIKISNYAKILKK